MRLALIISFSIASEVLAAASGSFPEKAPESITLQDQYEARSELTFPSKNVVVLTIADRDGADQVDAWIAALKPFCTGRIEMHGIADVSAVPRFLRGMIRKKFQKKHVHSVMMDWSGKVSARMGYQSGVANVLILGPDGAIHGRFSGEADAPEISRAQGVISEALASVSQTKRAVRPRADQLRTQDD